MRRTVIPSAAGLRAVSATVRPPSPRLDCPRESIAARHGESDDGTATAFPADLGTDATLTPWANPDQSAWLSIHGLARTEAAIFASLGGRNRDYKGDISQIPV